MDIGRHESLARDDAVEIDQCGVDGRGINGLRGRCQGRHAFGGLAPPRDAPCRQRIEDDAADHGRPGRGRPPQHEPVAGGRASEASTRSTAAAAPVGRSIASRPLRPTTTSAAAVPRWTRKRDRSGTEAASVTSNRSVACSSGSFVRTTPRCRRDAGSPARLSAVRPPPATSSAGVPWTWTSRTRTVASPGTMLTFAPRASGPPRSVPVTTVPRPLMWNVRSTARRTGRADIATQPGSAIARSRRVMSPARRSAIPSPVVPDTTTIGTPASAVDEVGLQPPRTLHPSGLRGRDLPW